MKQHSRFVKGFTLLEVIVALTITGIALGALFGVIGGNKQLAWRSEAVLLEATRIRTMINLSQLNEGWGEVDIELLNDDLELLTGGEFETPVRKTQGGRHALRRFEIRDAAGRFLTEGSYRVELELPE